jgi:predicted AlkP superfamily pyrophosphatase or phosphodiesterase
MKRIVCICVVLFTVLLLTSAYAKQQDSPKLVLEIVVDQLRGDMPAMVLDRCCSGGFRYLIEKGTWYKNAHHPHANTETIVGHVTLSTGAYPSNNRRNAT